MDRPSTSSSTDKSEIDMTDTIQIAPVETGREGAAAVEIAAPEESVRGFGYALACFLLWGILPLFMKLLAHIPAPEVVAHRIVWSLPIAAGTVLWLGLGRDVLAALRSPRTVLMAAVTASFITVNWGLYVWAVGNGRALETALGYYINPLVSVAMGALLLGERLSRAQIAAVGLAAVAVVVLTAETGGLPWVSLALAISFAIYGYLRKTLPIGPSQGFFVEILILSVPAIAYIVWLEATGVGHFRVSQPGDIGLLVACGPVTAVPLILYAAGAKRLRFSTIGIMQYIAPTLVFLTAVFLFGEPFGWAQGAAFAIIWAALVLYSWSMFTQSRGDQPRELSPRTTA